MLTVIVFLRDRETTLSVPLSPKLLCFMHWGVGVVYIIVLVVSICCEGPLATRLPIAIQLVVNSLPVPLWLEVHLVSIRQILKCLSLLYTGYSTGGDKCSDVGLTKV